jgi:isopenicillin-N N-acyltransferase-like protein
MNQAAILLVDVKGDAYSRGRQQGAGARTQILGMLAHYHQILPQATDMGWPEAVRETQKSLPYGEEIFPGLVDELRGIAEGADVPFPDVWTLACYESLTQRGPVWGCTCMAVRDDHTADGHVLLAHNEDWHSQDRDHVYLVRAEPDDGPAFIGLTYGPLPVMVGLNAAGIGVGVNSVYPVDVRVGVPRLLCARAIMRAGTIGEAIRVCMPKLRAGGYNYLLADLNGELYNVETSATAHAIVYGEDGWLAHTNHYVAPKMQALEVPAPRAGSHVRLNRARRLLGAQLGHVSVESLQAVLCDHVNFPDAICSHENPADLPHERGQTVASLVMDLTDRVLWAAPGPPCEHAYVRYPL